MSNDKFTASRVDKPDLTFRGKLLATANTKRLDGSDSRWEEFNLYQTEASQSLICVKSVITEWQGEDSWEDAVIVPPGADHWPEIFAFFGFSEDAKSLYKEAGINADEEVA